LLGAELSKMISMKREEKYKVLSRCFFSPGAYSGICPGGGAYILFFPGGGLGPLSPPEYASDFLRS